MSESSDEAELPQWACPDCYEVLDAITEDSLHDKVEDHRRDCDGRSIHEAPDDAKYSATVKAPRDPDAYEMSEHFHSMYVRREAPSADSATLAAVMEHGRIKSTHVSGRYIFEHQHDGWLWWIVVKLADEAFYKPAEKHLAVTIFSPESDQHQEVEKYV